MENNKISVIKTGSLALQRLTAIVASTSPKLSALPYKDAERDIMSVVLAYMQQYSPYPESTSLLAIKNFAEQIISGYQHWIIDDIENFLKWFIENQSNPDVQLTGNKITFLKLSSVLPLYEEQRIDAIRNSKMSTTLRERDTPVGLTQTSMDVIKEIRQRLRPKYVPIPLSDEEIKQRTETTNILAEFDTLWATQQTRHGIAKYVTVDNTIIYVDRWEYERKFGFLKNYTNEA
jgi:hypothetical protein